VQWGAALTAAKTTEEQTTARERKPPGKPFSPGQSGNPKGRPAGSRNKATLAIDALLDGEAEALTRKAIEMAKTGDNQALRLCMDRIVPVRRDRPITFKLPKIGGPGQAADAMSAVLLAVSNAEITPMEASEIAKLLDVYVRTVETTDLAKRIAELEKTASK
jgi:hypothetical protein